MAFCRASAEQTRKTSAAIGVRTPSPSPSLIPAQLVAFALLNATAPFAPGLRNIPKQSTPVKPDEPEASGICCSVVAVGRMPRHGAGSQGSFGLHENRAEGGL